MIQVRTGSTRFPRKTLSVIEDKLMIWHIINRLKTVKKIEQIALITTTKEDDKIFLELAEKEFDFVFASRYKNGGGSDDDTILTLLGNKFFSLLGKIFFSLKIDDILYTYILGRTETFRKLELKSQDFRLCVEIPIKAGKKKFSYTNIPSFERKRLFGEKKVNEFRDGFMILIYMLFFFVRG